jgi:hypothetical protein
LEWRLSELKIKIDKYTTISVELSSTKKEVVLSIQTKGQEGKIFLSSILLNKNDLTSLITKFVTLKSKLE